MCWESAAFNMPANLENSALATGLERSVFIPVPKKGNAKECSNYHTVALTSHASKVMLKFSKPGFNSELPDVQAGFRNGKEPEVKLSTSVGSLKKLDNSRKTSTSALLTMPQPLIMQITTNWKILKEMEIPDHLICLLRNLYAGQEATVKTAHGTTDSFQIGKGVCQGCILSPCLFNFFAKYIM